VDEESRISTFSGFYRAHYSLIMATSERRLADHAAAEDATAEVFRVAWQHYEGGAELTLPWLYVVARNVIGSEYRRRSRMTALVDKVSSDTITAGIEGGDDEVGAELRAAMLRLKSSDREILFMAYWEDLSGAEIGEILG
jgi:RNA polymerase sigma factor (sigma-70 family)